MAEFLSDADVGLMSDEEVGAGPSKPALLSDADVGLLSDDEVGLGEKPPAEGFVKSNVRAFGSGLVPAAGAVVGGAAIGAAGGAAFGPPGMLVGGLVGGVAGGIAGDVAQDQVKNNFPGLDDRAQIAANEKEHYFSNKLSGLGPFAGAPGRIAGSLGARAFQGGMLGTLDVAQQYMQEGKVDPLSGAISAGFGAVFPHGNTVTRAIDAKVSGVVNKFIPGRPGKVRDPADAKEHADVGDTEAGVEPGDSPLTEGLPPDTSAQDPEVVPAAEPPASTIGNPQSAAEGSQTRYAKQRPLGMPEGNYQPTQGHHDPAVEAAMGANPDLKKPEPAQSGTSSDLSTEPTRPEAPEPQPLSKLPTAEEAGQPLGFPQVGEPVAMGANDAAPLAPGTPERAAKAIKRSREAGQIKLSEGRPPEGWEAHSEPEDRMHQFDYGGKQGNVTVQPMDGGKTLKIVYISHGANDPKNFANGQNSFGPRAMIALRDALLKAYPETTKIIGDRISGARTGKGEGNVEVKVMPAFKGETPINDSITPAQKAAGNYKKARTHDFGKPITIETHAGDIRRSKEGQPKWEVVSPYDYGDFKNTIGADGDNIDFARPKEGSPEHGQKHFIIDQKNTETGKFDEHKVFGNYKDQAAAVDAYNRGFSDGKGPQRMHAITEVSRPDLVKWLARHTKKPAKDPYSGKRPVAERAVAQDAAAKLRKAGNEEGARALLNAPEAKLAAAIEGKRTRKYGATTKEGTGKSAAYPIEGLPGSSTDTKPKAEAKARGHKAVAEWFNKSAPKKTKTPETDGQLLDRIKLSKAAASPEGWKSSPLVRPREWMLRSVAKMVMAKPTPGNIKKFRDAERELRGSDVDVENYRSGNRVEAEIARSRRSGDEAVDRATAQNVDQGRNTVEDDMNAAIDAKKAAPKGNYWDGLAERTLDRNRIPKKDRKFFDTPHEEAEAHVTPKSVKTRDDLTKKQPREVVAEDSDIVKNIDLAKVDKAAARRAEAEALMKKTAEAAPKPSEDVKASEGKHIKVVDPAEKQRMIDALNASMNKKAGEGHGTDRMSGQIARDLLTAFAKSGKALAKDQSGALNWNKIKSDFDRFLKYTDPTRFVDAMKKTDHKTFLAKKSGGVRDDYTRSIGEDLHTIGNNDVNHSTRALRKMQAFPKDISAAEREQIFHARDADSAGAVRPGKQPGKTNVESLPPKLKTAYDKHLKPLFDANDKMIAAGRAIDPTKFGEDVNHHISHIMNGDTSKYNMLMTKDDPLEQGHLHGLSVNANAAKERKYFALERHADGRRIVIEPQEKGGFSTWINGKEQRVKDPNFKFKDGDKYTVVPKKGKPVDFTMRHAMVLEKEAHVTINKKPVKYFKDAGFSAYVDNLQLSSMVRHMAELNRLTTTPEWKDWTTTNKNSKKVKDEGWAQSKMPNFEGTYMHPDLRAVFDDFAGNPQTSWQNLTNTVTKLIFLFPTAHAHNVLDHMIIGRGWDNFSIPKNLKMLSDLPSVIADVYHQGAYTREMNRLGAGNMYGKSITTDMVGQVAKAFQQDITRNPSRWGPIADKLGVPLLDFSNSIYRHSRNNMWLANDVMLQLRAKELERKGMPLDKAIKDMERDVPNYRTPTKLFGSRFLAEKFFNSAVFAFSRYHFGMINAYAHTVKDALSPHSTMGDRVEAAGKMMSLALSLMVLYPLVIDPAWQKLTGNPNAQSQRRGPHTIPSHIAGALKGSEDIMAPVRAAVTPTPALSTAMETFSNKDFRGKNIVEPGDVREAARGHLASGARAVGSELDHAARGLVAPYNMVSTAYKKGEQNGDTGLKGVAKAIGRSVRDQTLDIKEPSPAADTYERKLPIHTFRDVNQRYKKGGYGMIEELIDKVFGR